MSSAESVHVNGVDLCVECIGDPADRPILLIMGSSASMDWWEDDFCMRLVAGGRFVVRYDHRDTGQSPAASPAHLRTRLMTWSRIPQRSSIVST